jgi:hypothetical protein
MNAGDSAEDIVAALIAFVRLVRMVVPRESVMGREAEALLARVSTPTGTKPATGSGTRQL